MQPREAPGQSELQAVGIGEHTPLNAHGTDARGVQLLFVCTANQARSPIAAAIAQREFASRGVVARVESRGTHAVDGAPALEYAVAVMRAEGVDLSEHRSRLVDLPDLDRSDLVLTMTRAHLRHLATLQPAAFPRLFPLRELVDRVRGENARRDETMSAWVARVGHGRKAADLLDDDPRLDVEDPAGCELDVYVALVRELANAISRIIDAGWPESIGARVGEG
jgi:protein-tyrosine phosphatase